MLLWKLLEEARDSKPALIFEGESFSYSALDDAANRFCHLFSSLGIQSGDRVSLLMGNEPLTVQAYFGLFKYGAIANPINNRLTAAEINFILMHAQSALLLTTAAYAHLAEAAVKDMENPPQVLVFGTVEGPLSVPHLSGARLDEQPDSRPAAVATDENAPCLLIYTSGTTGRPKGVLLSHKNVWADGHALSRAFGIDENHTALCLMPLFHCNALIVTHLSTFIGHGTVLLCRKFSATNHWKWVAQYGVRSFSAPPAVLAILLEREAEARGVDIHLDFVKTGSAPLTRELARRFESRFGENILVEGWGLTEATATSTLNPLRMGEPRRPGSVGQALPGQRIAVLDERGQELPVGQVGELAIRSDTVMLGYFRDPQATEAAFINGWLRTGDLGRMDDDGYVYLSGRKKEIIIRGGENISPLEIEDVIAQHPQVKEVAVGGVPDRIWGEVVVACVVPSGPVAVDDLLDYCRENLADFKVPTRIALVDSLPRNAIGKILRRQLNTFFTDDMAENRS